MKNTLAENMIRFGAKNLSELDITKIEEQTDTIPFGFAILSNTSFVPGTTKMYPDIYLTKDLANKNASLSPALVVKFGATGGFVGVLQNNPVALYASLGKNTPTPGAEVTQISDLNAGPQVNPSGWNELQWIQFLDKMNTNNVLTVDGVTDFFSDLSKTGIPTKFGTLIPSRLDALKLAPEKLNVYKNGIAQSGINQNFKTA